MSRSARQYVTRDRAGTCRRFFKVCMAHEKCGIMEGIEICLSQLQ